MSTSGKSRLRIIPYSIIITLMFLVVVPISIESSIILLIEIPEYLMGNPNLDETIRDEIILPGNHVVDLTSEHWYDVFGSENYLQQAYGPAFDGFFPRVFLLFVLPNMGVMAFLMLMDYSISKLKWIGIVIISTIVTIIGILLILGTYEFFCPSNVELCKIF